MNRDKRIDGSTVITEDMRSMIPVLETQWNLAELGGQWTLHHYGIPNFDNPMQQTIPVGDTLAAIISGFDGERRLADVLTGGAQPKGTDGEALRNLIEAGIIVDLDARRPAITGENYKSCVRCVNNDYIIPGLEFDGDGQCAFCQLFDKLRDVRVESLFPDFSENFITEEELLHRSGNRAGRFDAMVLYTGGKDSSYLLWYLSKKLGLRVMACSWCLPFANESSRVNILAAKKRLPDVEFIERTMRWSDVREEILNQFPLKSAPCICYEMTFALFYPLAFLEKIPLILSGISPVQLLERTTIFYINNPAMFRKHVAGGAKSLSDRMVDYAQRGKVEIQSKKKKALAALKMFANREVYKHPVYGPLQDIIHNAGKQELPLVKQLVKEYSGDCTFKDLYRIAVFDSLDDIIDTVSRELDWKMPEGQNRQMHTNCLLEPVKDYCQMKALHTMNRRYMPQTIIEICAAVFYGHITREDALVELRESGYLDAPEALRPLLQRLGIDEHRAREMEGVLPHLFG
jgi:hypothetical protein